MWNFTWPCWIALPAGDAELFDRLNTKVLPGSEKQAARFFSRNSPPHKDRLARYGKHHFHLDQRKGAPGGYATISRHLVAPDRRRGRELLTAAPPKRSSLQGAVDFLSAIRCFLLTTTT